MTTLKKAPKALVEIRRGAPQHWVGDGFHVRSLFSYDDPGGTPSPFILLDYGAPHEFPPTTGEPRGVGEHPHRGFETVTIAYQGEIEHRDSAGHQGKIGPRDVQWMTAASGVVHEEKHGREFSRKGGVMEMVQLWVNLPSKYKMSPPRYQDLLDRNIPVAPLPHDAGTVRVIAGAFAGIQGPAKTFTPINLWDLKIRKGQPVELPLTEGHSAALLVLRGPVELNGGGTAGTAGEGDLAVLDRQGQTLSLKALKDSSVLLMSGEPIEEPVVGYGPFVMNTRSEIVQAARDYQSGKMGSLAP